MKIAILSLFLAITVFCGNVVEVTAAPPCVKCEIVQSQKQLAWECVPITGGGAQACSTSTGQQDCLHIGTCKGMGLLEDECSQSGKDITISKDTVSAVYLESSIFGRSLDLISERGALGYEGVKVFSIENGAVVEVVANVVYDNKIPTKVVLTRTDTSQTIELYVQQEVDLTDINKESWSVVNWLIK